MTPGALLRVKRTGQIVVYQSEAFDVVQCLWDGLWCYYWTWEVEPVTGGKDEPT